jgi:hypothetical protein
MEENIVLEDIRYEQIYASGIRDEIINAELNNNILAFITKKDPTYIKIFNIEEKEIIKTIKTGYNITLIKFNPLNNFEIACASEEKKVTIINFENNEITKKDIEGGIINSIVWNNDGTKIAYSSDKNIIIWNILINKQEGKTLTGHSKTIQSIDWNNNKIISGGRDKIIIWDVENNFSKIEIKNESTKILKLIPNNNYFISYYDNNIKLFDTNGNLINNIVTNYNIEGFNIIFNIYNITFLKNSNNFLCSCSEGYILFDYNDINNILNINVLTTFLIKNIFIDLYQNKDFIIINDSGPYIYVQKKINLIELAPLINNNFLNSYNSIKFVYIKLFFTNYKFFTKYIIKNKIDKNYNYENNFLEIINSDGFYNSVKNNLIEFVDYIAQFLNSVNTTSSREINKIIENNKLENYKIYKEIINKYVGHNINQNINITQKEKFLKYINTFTDDLEYFD